MKQIYNILFISVISLIFFACQSDEEALRENVGYLRVALEQSAEVNTKADGYEAKRMHVEIKNAEGAVKFQTDDHTTGLADKEISLTPGEYTIEARSNAYDNASGADRAYYMGTTKVQIKKGETTKAEVKCSLANVKVTVAFEQGFLDKLGTGSIRVQVKSANTAANAVDFQKNTERQVAYFPLGDLTVAYTVTSKDGEKTSNKELPITNVAAKDHYILNFKNQSTGTGNVSVTVDPTMHLYTYDFTVDPNAKNGATLSASAWSRFVYLTAADITLDNGDLSTLKFQYRKKGTESWTDAETEVQEEASTATATVRGLTAATEYEYQLTDGSIEIAKDGKFSTETEIALQNGNLDGWVGDPAREDVSPNAVGETKFWDTSNTGANSVGKKNPTRGVTSPVHTLGGMAAKLESMVVLSRYFAAASLYTGSFGKVQVPNAIVNFGQPFTSRPVALKGFYKYTPKDITKISNNAPAGVAEGQMDQCAIYIALTKKSYSINNGDVNTFINFKEDSNVIAYGELPSGAATAGDDYVEFNIPLKYKNLTERPSHIIVVCSSSKYGDYMTGGVGSTLYVDDLSLIYDGEPTLWE